jgi:hypothetical protein
MSVQGRFGHLRVGPAATASIYAPDEAGFLGQAVHAIEEEHARKHGSSGSDLERDLQLQPIESDGGPGRIRTCDNTVMSGAF